MMAMAGGGGAQKAWRKFFALVPNPVPLAQKSAVGRLGHVDGSAKDRRFNCQKVGIY
jgi:hypothetical protein